MLHCAQTGNNSECHSAFSLCLLERSRLQWRSVYSGPFSRLRYFSRLCQRTDTLVSSPRPAHELARTGNSRAFSLSPWYIFSTRSVDLSCLIYVSSQVPFFRCRPGRWLRKAKGKRGQSVLNPRQDSRLSRLYSTRLRRDRPRKS